MIVNHNARRKKREYITLAIDIPTILQDLKKVIWIIFCLSVPVSLLSYVSDLKKYEPEYSAETRYIVALHSLNNSMLTSIDLGSKIADRYTQIIQSDVLKKKVAEDTGIPENEFSITSSRIEKTNLFKVSVVSNSPQKAYNALRSVMRNYTTVTDYFPDEAYTEVLIEPVVPSGSYTYPPSVTGIVKVFILVFGGMTGLFAGLSCLKDTIRFKTDVGEKLDVPFLGAVTPKPETGGNLKKLKKNKKPEEGCLIIQADADPEFIESVHKTARKIRHAMEEENAKTLLFTSTNENEGKSFIAANLTLALAEQGRKVVLVDLDLKKPELFKIFNIPDTYECGLKEYLTGEETGPETVVGTIPETETPAVFNREEIAQRAEILSGERIKKLFDYLKEKYEYVIIDSSPMSVSSNTEAVVGLADAAVMVAKAHDVSAKKINDELDIIYRCQTKIIGCIVNGVHSPVGSDLGGFGYRKKTGKGFGLGKLRRKKA